MPVLNVKQGFFPLDEQLGLQDSHWSEGIAKQAIWVSGLVTYDDAARVLQEIGQVAISDSSVWRLTQKWGGRLQAMEAQEQEQAHRLPACGEVQPRPRYTKKRMELSMDGTMIYIRGESRDDDE